MTSLAALERNYYRVLSDVARREGVVDVRVPDDLPTKLEQLTLPRLSRSSRWFLSGMSGSGKSTVVEILKSQGYERVPNVVTRPRRPEESEKDNVFVDDKTFLEMESRRELFHPHVTNSVRHAILRSDIEKLVTDKQRFYMDKSVPSVLEILKEYPELKNSSFLYIVAPSFQILHERITTREKGGSRADGLSAENVLSRFEEEIRQLNEATSVPYAYILNDSLARVETLLRLYI